MAAVQVARIRTIAIAGAVCAAARAGAFPIVGALLDGDVRELGRGGAGGFGAGDAIDPWLSDPARLAAVRAPALRLVVRDENGLQIRDGRYAGTRLLDRVTAIGLWAPLPGGPAGLVLAAGLDRAVGEAVFHDGQWKFVLASRSDVRAARAALAARALAGLDVGAAYFVRDDGGSGYAFQAVLRPSEALELELRRRVEPRFVDLEVPSLRVRAGPVPPLRYAVRERRRSDRVRASVGEGAVRARFEADLAAPHDPRAELTATAGPLTFRAAWTRQSLSIEGEAASLEQGTVARGGLDLVRERWMGRIDVALGAATLQATAATGTLRGALWAQEAERGAARALFGLDLDLGFQAGAAFRARVVEAGLGFAARPAGLDLGLGLRYVRLTAEAGEVRFAAARLAWTDADAFAGGVAELLGATVGLGAQIGGFSVRGALVQFVPIAYRQGGAAPAPAADGSTVAPPPQPAPSTSPGNPLESLRNAAGRFDGGRMAIVEMVQSW